MQLCNSYRAGLQDGVPIGLGYLSVSFAFGIAASSAGIPAYIAVLISMTNLTSAGQLAGLTLMTAGGSLIEAAVTQLVINLRYALMLISISQKASAGFGIKHRLLGAFFITDEIFAVAVSKSGQIGPRYWYGLGTVPYFGWAAGTLLGALAGHIMPDFIISALGIAIYGMFIAIIVPPAKKSRPVLLVVLTAAALRCLFTWIPGLQQISAGFAIILCAIAAATLGAALRPVRTEA